MRAKEFALLRLSIANNALLLQIVVEELLL